MGKWLVLLSLLGACNQKATENPDLHAVWNSIAVGQVRRFTSHADRYQYGEFLIILKRDGGFTWTVRTEKRGDIFMGFNGLVSTEMVSQVETQVK